MTNKLKELQTELRDLFEQAIRLPEKEIERIVSRIKKGVLNWEGLIREAPEFYEDRSKREKLPSFLRRVYLKPGHLQKGLTIPHFDVLDEQLAFATRNYERRHGLPEDLRVFLIKNRGKKNAQKSSENEAPEDGPSGLDELK